MINLENKIIAFVGTGNLAEALIQGILEAGLFPSQNILAFDVRGERLEELKKRYGIVPCLGNAEAVSKADIILLAVKPQVIPKALQEIVPAADGSKLFISVAAGVPMAVLSSLLGAGDVKRLRIVRVMPNTPALVQEGAAALAQGDHATEKDLQTALDIFNAVGKTVVVNESLLDAVTGLSGSGPAYVCAMVEALSDAGAKMGLPRDIAFTLSLQTILGTAKLIEKTGKQPSELREMVTSPGGTTIHGLQALEKGKFRDAVINAVEAATRRARELGKESGGK